MAHVKIFQYLYDYLDAVITQQTSPEEAYRKFDDLVSKHMELLRKLTKSVQEARNNHDDDGVKRTVNEYEEALERYLIFFLKKLEFFTIVQIDKILQAEKQDRLGFLSAKLFLD